MQNALNDYIAYCRVERRLADLTWKAYERVLRGLIAFLRTQGISSLAEVHTRDLRAFLAGQAERRPAPSSQAQTVVAVLCFFRLCVESDYLDRDPAYVLRTPKKREALPDILDPERACPPARGARQAGRLDAPARLQDRARPPAARPVRLQRPAPRRDHRPRHRRRGPRPAPAARRQGQGRQGTCRADPPRSCALVRRLPGRAARHGRDGTVPRRLRQTPERKPHGPDVPPLRYGSGRQQAQAHNAPYATTRLRDRASERRGEPAPDSGASRAQAPGLDAALHTRQRPSAPRRRQAPA